LRFFAHGFHEDTGRAFEVRAGRRKQPRWHVNVLDENGIHWEPPCWHSSAVSDETQQPNLPEKRPIVNADRRCVCKIRGPVMRSMPGRRVSYIHDAALSSVLGVEAVAEHFRQVARDAPILV